MVYDEGNHKSSAPEVLRVFAASNIYHDQLTLSWPALQNRCWAMLESIELWTEKQDIYKRR
jgi:hypothetical protein